jgi:hypothetical protein
MLPLYNDCPIVYAISFAYGLRQPLFTRPLFSPEFKIFSSIHRPPHKIPYCIHTVFRTTKATGPLLRLTNTTLAGNGVRRIPSSGHVYHSLLLEA